MENFRRAIGLRIKETKEVYEGEVTEMTPVETDSTAGGKIKINSIFFLLLNLNYFNYRLFKNCVSCYCWVEDSQRY